MKKLVVLIAAAAGFAACQNAATNTKAAKDTANYTTIRWIDSVKDIGTVEAGKKAEIQFGFVNTGSKPLFIISAKPGCGCTIADYPKEAIAPGAEGVITAGYNVPENGQSDFRKNIVVTANTKGSATQNIFFYGEIKGNGDSTHKSSAVK